MRTSETIDQLAIALAAAQSEIEAAPKDKLNPHFKSRYADLASIWEACRGPLGKHGIAVVQSPSVTPERFLKVTTRVLHKSGQWIESELDLKPAQDTPQGMGSAITYARRYTLSSLIGVVSEEDDDGNASSIKPAYSRPKIEEAKPRKIFDPKNEAMVTWLKADITKHGFSSEDYPYIADQLNGKDLLTEYKSVLERIRKHSDPTAGVF